MDKDRRLELIEGFIKANAEKYKAMEIRNKCVDNKINIGSTNLVDSDLQRVENYVDAANKEFLEQDYRFNSFIRTLDIPRLNTFSSLIKKYSNQRELEIEEYRKYIDPLHENSWEGYNAKEEVAYFEKYERLSIKNLLYMIARRKGEKFGMNDEYARKYATCEIDKLIDIDILFDELPKTKKRD